MINWLNMSDRKTMNIAGATMDSLMRDSTELDHERHVKKDS